MNGFKENQILTDNSIALVRKVNKIDGKISKKSNPNYLEYVQNGDQNFNCKSSERLFPLCNIVGEREIVYITGASGSGKTYFANKYIMNYHKIYPENKLIYLSNNDIDNDKSVEMPHLYTVLKPDDLVNYMIDNYDEAKVMKTFSNSIILCDDLMNIHSTKHKNIVQQVHKFIDRALELFRRINCSIVYIAHNETEYRLTRLLLTELTKYICFPSLKLMTNRVLLNYHPIPRALLKEFSQVPNRHDFILIDTQKRYIMNPYKASVINF